MIALDWHILGFLDIVDALQDGQAVAYTRNSHALQIVMLESHERFAYYLVFCMRVSVLR